MTRRLKITLLLIPLLAITACAGSSDGVEITESDGRTLAVADASDSGSDAAVDGTLALSDNSCWGIEQADGTFLLIIWPQGTSPAGDGLNAPSPAGEIALGTPLRLSGGDISSSAEADAVRETCDASEAFRAWKVERP